MKSILAKSLMIVAAAGLMFIGSTSLMGCKEKEPDAKISDGLKEAGEGVEDAAEDIKDEADDAIEEIGDDIEDATDNP